MLKYVCIFAPFYNCYTLLINIMENKDKYTVEVIVPYLGCIKVATFYFYPSFELVELSLSCYEQKFATSIDQWRIRCGRNILAVHDRLPF